jgi:hypothetical protein
MKDNTLNVFIGCIISAVFVAIFFLTGCATFKHVVRTVDDVASAACQLFAQQNPDEFALLVAQVSPPHAEQVKYAGFNVVEICAIHEVLKPFIDAQLELQRGMAISVQAGQDHSDADLPK